eukprot:gb/GECG01011467.1/.p1 GENE.gb/GECG01011467.1/~~gb/GECG01011467.1/.p1  ORF type:complete len:106 (+),score=6.83 gb/GECG01011467.1/:1-318(+)
MSAASFRKWTVHDYAEYAIELNLHLSGRWIVASQYRSSPVLGVSGSGAERYEHCIPFESDTCPQKNMPMKYIFSSCFNLASALSRLFNSSDFNATFSSSVMGSFR